MSPALWSRIIRESKQYLAVTLEQFAERLGVGRSTVSAWLDQTRTPPTKRLGSIQRKLLALEIPRDIVYLTEEIDRPLPVAQPSQTPRQRKREQRRQPALRDVFRVVDKMLARQNAKMTAELKAALSKLLHVEVNEMSRKP